MMEKLKKPAEDLRFLLSRGYPKYSALEFVCNHYLLNRKERNILLRVVHEREIIDSVKIKLTSVDEIKDEMVAIDGFNVLATIEAILDGDPVYECDDGMIRDARGVFGKFKLSTSTIKAIRLCCNMLSQSELFWFFEKNISKSGEFAKTTRDVMKNMNVSGVAKTVKSVDFVLKNWDGIVATSDTAIIIKAKKILDIPSEIVKTLKVSPVKI